MLLFHISESATGQLSYYEIMQKILKLKQGGDKYIMKCLKTLIDNNLIQRSLENSQEAFSDTEILRLNA